MPRSRSSSGVAVGHCAAAIRSAQQADLLEIVRLAADSLESPLSTDAVQAELDRGLATVLVAEQPQPSGGIVGALVGWRVAADVLEVHELMVHPAHRRQGIAGMLLLHFEDSLRGGAGEVQLEVRAGNSPALALYLRLGYRKVGRRRQYYPDGEDAVLMTRCLQ